MYLCRVTVSSNDDRWREALCLALKPEEDSPPSHRSKMSVKCCERSVTIVIESRDLASFRAAVNSLLRLLKAVEDIEVAL